MPRTKLFKRVFSRVSILFILFSQSPLGSLLGTVWTASASYTQADFTAFDGVDIGTNSYTVSPSITATYNTGAGTESVQLS